MPSQGQYRPSLIAAAESTPTLMDFIKKNVSTNNSQLFDTILKMADLEVMACAVYSPAQVDLIKLSEQRNNYDNILKMNLGVMLMAKSGLPGLVVGQAVKNYLGSLGFTETKEEKLTLYQGSWTYGNIKVPVLVRVEGSSVYAVVSSQETYARSLLSAVLK
jgi:hypothetical protein